MLQTLLSTAAFLISIVTLGVTYRSWQLGDRRSRIPVLVFVDSPGRHWRLKNVGNGPALNVVVVQKGEHDDPEWTEPTRVTALGRDEEVELAWLQGRNVAVLGATYVDMVGADGTGPGRAFTTLCSYNVNSVQSGRRLPDAVLAGSLADWQRVRERKRAAEAS